MTALDCPICDGNALESLPRSGDYIEVTCLDCGHYRISQTAAKSIADRPAEERKGLLEQARNEATGDAIAIVGGVRRA